MANPINNKNSFGTGLLMFAACAAVSYFAWPTIKAHLGPDMTSYSDPGEYGGGRSTGARNRSGVEPYGGDGHGGGRGYSDYFPGPREGRPDGVAQRRQNLRLDPSATDDVEDRRGERRDGLNRLGPNRGEARADEAPGGARGSGLACWDKVERRQVDLSLCGGRR
jgi:hypothetical protein